MQAEDFLFGDGNFVILYGQGAPDEDRAQGRQTG